jgi:hypothetical protein
MSYESLTRMHLKPGLGKVPLAKLQPAHVQQFMAAEVEAGMEHCLRTKG